MLWKKASDLPVWNERPFSAALNAGLNPIPDQEK
jgi:hypothetical protein